MEDFGWTLDGSDESITEYLGVADGRILDVCSRWDDACIEAGDADKKVKSLPSITSNAVSADDVVIDSSLDVDSVVRFFLCPFCTKKLISLIIMRTTQSYIYIMYPDFRTCI